ncbi:hypothetical protein D9M73_118120 [compost metagenome]
MLELRPHLGIQAFRIALGGLLPRQPRKLLLRRATRDLDFVRILVFELLKAERASGRQLHRTGDRAHILQIASEKALHLRCCFQMAVGKALTALAQIIDRAFLADTGDDILQKSAVGCMIEDVVGSDRRHPRCGSHGGKIAKPDRVAWAPADRQCRIAAISKDAAHASKRGLGRGIGAIGYEERDQAIVPFFEVRPVQMTGAFACASLADAQESAHATIGRLIGGIDEQCRAVSEIQSTAHYRTHAGRLFRVPGTYNPCNRMPIDNAKGRQPKERGCGKKLLWTGGSAQKAEMGRDLQLHVAASGGHANAPWMNQRIGPVTGFSPSPARKSQ